MIAITGQPRRLTDRYLYLNIDTPNETDRLQGEHRAIYEAVRAATETSPQS
ncbi:hypothetical protein [Sphaerisporangium album]|uniref:hypothetical protein n=1 Tax=Sphaerisporangium album TaxID=509200 RepID=UPI0015F064F9|nr:hypothetical protein [Sphaerisporangium album]